MKIRPNNSRKNYIWEKKMFFKTVYLFKYSATILLPVSLYPECLRLEVARIFTFQILEYLHISSKRSQV